MIAMFMTWGDGPECHFQAAFAIATVLSAPEVERVALFSSRPGRYRLFDGAIDIHALDDRTLAEWRGPDGYSFRPKIKGIEAAALAYPGKDLAFLDGDTFRYAGLEPLGRGLAGGRVFMHERHFLLRDCRDGTNRRFWRAARGKSFRGLVVDDATGNWNSGVVAMPGKDAAELVRRTLAVNDDLYARSGPRRYWAAEQMAFGLVLAEYAGERGIAPADGMIGHYWGNKPGWNEVIGRFFAEAALRGDSLEDMVRNAGNVDFRAIPVHVRRPKTPARMRRIAEALFRERNVRYAGSAAK